MANFEKDFPEFSKRGFGPTTKAERWNGRHAMFGWVVILATGYAQSHNLIPNFDAPLDLSAWGPLARQGDYSSITNGRAIILIAHVHALFVSLASSLSPFGFQDSLTLNMKAAERDEAAYGACPCAARRPRCRAAPRRARHRAGKAKGGMQGRGGGGGGGGGGRGRWGHGRARRNGDAPIRAPRRGVVAVVAAAVRLALCRMPRKAAPRASGACARGTAPRAAALTT